MTGRGEVTYRLPQQLLGNRCREEKEEEIWRFSEELCVLFFFYCVLQFVVVNFGWAIAG